MSVGMLMVLCIVLLSTVARSALGDQVTIYDTSKLESLNWDVNKNPDFRVAWRESSYNLESGNTVRIVAVCNVEFNNVRNWISTPPLIIPASVNRIYVNIIFTVRKCERYPNPASLQQCKEVFKLAYDESDREDPDWNAFVTVDTIAATNLFSALGNNVPINNETKSIGLSQSTSLGSSRSVRLAFFDEGSCTTLVSVRVYHIVCPEVVVLFVKFPNTEVGPDLTSVVEANGVCVDNGVPIVSSNSDVFNQAIRRICQADGKWFRMENGGCHCKAGYQPNASASYDSCIECPPNYYKSTAGNHNCLYCPANSISHSSASSFCSCILGFERLDPISFSDPCYKIIGSIRNLTVANISESSVLLSWQHPSDMTLPIPPSSSSFPPSLVYYVDCPACDESPFVKYLPKKYGQFTSLSIIGLMPSTSYAVTIRLRNETSKREYNSSSVSTTFSTLSSSATGPSDGGPLSPPIRAYVLAIMEDSVQLVWETSLPLRSFEIVVHTDINKEQRRVHVYDFRNVTIDRLEPGQTYSFLIRGETTNGWTAFSNPVSAKIGDVGSFVPVNLPHGGQDANLIGAAVGGVIAGLALLLVLALIIVIFYYRKFKSPSECTNSSSDCDIMKYVNATIKAVPRIQSNTSSDSTMRSGESFHIYADPISFDQDTTTTSLKSLELNPSFVSIRNILSKTWAGEIGHGVLASPDNRPDKLVTIETVKREAVLRGRRADVKVGAGVLKKLDHPNIIKVEGFVSSPSMIVLEYMQNGCLKDFLLKNGKSCNLTFIRLVTMLKDVSSGMNYISERGLIHQNLTTESILVNGNWICKISSIHSVTTIESTTDLKSGSFTNNIPPSLIRWTAPEVLFDSKTSISSDVWSFGMVMWHTLSRGEDPYNGWTDEEVVRAVSNSMCLSTPSNDCPEALYQLMMQCWRLHKDARPSFSYLLQILTSFCEGTPISVAPSFHITQDKSGLGITVDSESNQFTSAQNLAQSRTMLANNGTFPQVERSNTTEYPYLAMYWDLLQSKGYNTIEKILMLEDPALLVSIGITSPTHQFFLLNEIQKLRHKESDNEGVDFNIDHNRPFSASSNSTAATVVINCPPTLSKQGSHRSRPHSQQINYQHFNNLENVQKFQNNNLTPALTQQQISPPPAQANPSEFSSRQNLLLATSQLNLSNDNQHGVYNSSSNIAKLHHLHYPSYNSFTSKPSRTPNNGPNDKTQKYRMGISALTTQKHSGDNFFV